MHFTILLPDTITSVLISFIEFNVSEFINSIGIYILISLGLGFLMALIIAFDKKSKLNNVHKANSAMDYLKTDATHLYQKDDVYLRTDHIRTPINRQNGGHGGGPGFGGPGMPHGPRF